MFLRALSFLPDVASYRVFCFFSTQPVLLAEQLLLIPQQFLSRQVISSIALSPFSSINSLLFRSIAIRLNSLVVSGASHRTFQNCLAKFINQYHFEVGSDSLSYPVGRLTNNGCRILYKNGFSM